MIAELRQDFGAAFTSWCAVSPHVFCLTRCSLQHLKITSKPDGSGETIRAQKVTFMIRDVVSG
jgi:hypothetical protein